MKIKEVIATLESWAPLSYQEDWDNSGLIIGNPDESLTGILISLDTTIDIMEEALSKKCNLIISHHPVIFKGIRKITPSTPSYKVIQTAIRNNTGIYALHTNLDNKLESLNKYLGKKLGLTDISILQPLKGYLKKLVTFCPVDHTVKVRQALFNAGAGRIGAYDSCSFTGEGQGSFRASEDANPFVGRKNEIHFEQEQRIEVIFPADKEKRLIDALLESHPYEEVAYDVYLLANLYWGAGSGITGILPKPRKASEFLQEVKKTFGIPMLRSSATTNPDVSTVAVCSGAGSFLIPEVLGRGIDIYLTGDLKYHDFQDITGKLIIADIGHYESEQFVKEMLGAVLKEKFPNFAVLISEQEINPIKYI